MFQYSSENDLNSNKNEETNGNNMGTNYHLFIAQLCTEIDDKHQHLNAHIASLVSNCGDLKLNAKFWTYLLNNLDMITLLKDLDEDSAEINLTNKQKFMTAFYNLLMCINKLEKELAVYLTAEAETTEFLFDVEFFLSLAFLIFEKVTHLTLNEAHSQSDNSAELIFELDLTNGNGYDSTIWLFELNLNSLLEKYVLKFLPDLIELQKVLSVSPLDCSYGSGKSSLEFFKNLFRQEDFSVRRTSSFDIDLLISKPCVSNNPDDFLSANPITQSYKCLISNLNALKFCAHDPYGEADETAAQCGREVNNVSFGCLAFSYLSMGYFEIRMLLENSFQFLYEIQLFNNEFKNLFRPDHEDQRLWKQNFTKSSHIEPYLNREMNDCKHVKNKKNLESKWNIEIDIVNNLYLVY